MEYFTEDQEREFRKILGRLDTKHTSKNGSQFIKVVTPRYLADAINNSVLRNCEYAVFLANEVRVGKKLKFVDREEGLEFISKLEE